MCNINLWSVKTKNCALNGMYTFPEGMGWRNIRVLPASLAYQQTSHHRYHWSIFYCLYKLLCRCKLISRARLLWCIITVHAAHFIKIYNLSLLLVYLVQDIKCILGFLQQIWISECYWTFVTDIKTLFYNS
jgi:hypothetical protein